MSTPSRKRRASTYATPSPKIATRGAAKRVSRYAAPSHVPRDIYKSVGYTPREDMPIDDFVVQFVTQHYDIPDDFESSKFGPHSGTTYGRRLYTAMRLNKLQPKDAPHKLCRACKAVDDHFDDECADT